MNAPFAFFKKRKDDFLLKRFISSVHATLSNHSIEQAPEIKLTNLPTEEKFKQYPYINKLANLFTGKLLLRKEIHLTNRFFEKLLQHRFFTAVPAITRIKYQKTCIRCNNQDKVLFEWIACEICSARHVYCRNCIQMGRVMECESLYYWTGPQFKWQHFSDPCSWEGTLAQSQAEAASRIKALIDSGGKLLIWAVTGSGKTEMLFRGITHALQSGKRVCLATPRADVVRELFPRLQEAFSGVFIQALYGGSRDKDGTAQLIIATTHQLLRYRNAFDVLIIDEIDAFPFHQDTALQFAAKSAVKPDHAMIYLTATPREVQQKQMEGRQLNHVFVPIRFHKQPLIVPKLIYCNQLTKQLANEKLPPAFLSWLKQRKQPHRQLLFFLPTIRLTNQLQEVMSETLQDLQLIKAPAELAVVHAEDELRPEKIQLFRERKIYCLLTTTILERGVTFPAIDVAVLHASHIVFDEAALVQIAGRVGRSAADPVGELVFFHDGKTNAMVRAAESIRQMNRRRQKYLQGGPVK